MLSILIPTYNYECYELAHELSEQGQKLQMPFEIIVADDASREEMKVANRKINQLQGARYIELKENLGRARIRNYLGEQACGEYLLFLDSDVRVCSDNFLSKYVEAIRGKGVICGSTRFRRRIPERNRTLRYTYGVTREEKSAEACNQKPYARFTSINFLIDKETFREIHFNEQFTQYGHEDTLLGKELELAQIPIRHIDNPIYHEVPDTNEEFLNKTHKSIENSLKHRDVLIDCVRLLQVYEKIKTRKLRLPILLGFKLSRKYLYRNLSGSHPSMKLFSLYKLGYICYIDK